jgi:hypothetical protein
MERLEAHRAFFASLITASAGVPAGRLSEAFAATPRERFLGPGPWKIFTSTGYITTPSDDPSFLYQDVTVALSEASKINNGQPVLHAVSLSALNPQPGEMAVHIGAGTGYFSGWVRPDSYSRSTWAPNVRIVVAKTSEYCAAITDGRAIFTGGKCDDIPAANHAQARSRSTSTIRPSGMRPLQGLSACALGSATKPLPPSSCERSVRTASTEIISGTIRPPAVSWGAVFIRIATWGSFSSARCIVSLTTTWRERWRGF